MQLSDLSLGVVLLVVSLGTIVVTAATWNRGTRIRRMYRIAALTVSQLCVVVTAAAFVNVPVASLTSWGELVSKATGTAPTPEATPTGKKAVHAAPSPAAKTPVVTVPRVVTPRPVQLKAALATAAATAAASAAKRPGKGTIVKIRLTGASTKFSFDGRLYLPAAYFDNSTPKRRFPVIQFFSGFPGSNIDIAFNRLALHDALDLAIAKGKLPPTIVVVAQQYPNPHRDTECLDVKGGARTESYLAVDVPNIIASELRVSQDRAHWTALGYSSGGYCAINLALRHPERYGNVISLAGNTKPNIDKQTGEVFGKDQRLFDANNPQVTILTPHPALNFFMFSPKGDVGGLYGISGFAPHVTVPDKVTTLYKPQGGHNSPAWRWALPYSFDWLNTTMPPVVNGA
jgi:enterochelin esterase-like enzyme